MEIPNELKNLYKHWEKHTIVPSESIKINLDNDVINNIKSFINERNLIYEKKYKGEEKPYTKDKILSEYKFCNIYRELDRQTIFYHKLLKNYENDFPLWLLNMLFCRAICNTETMSKVGLLNFDQENNNRVYRKLLKLSSPKYGNAYIFPISIILKTKWNTREKFFCLYFPKVIKEMANEIETFNDVSVGQAIDKIIPIFGFNCKFLLTELMIDVAYQYPNYINLFKQFPIGPGSRPTMKMLNNSEDVEKVNLSLVGRFDTELNLLEYNGRTVYLSAENWEGIGCEFRKYTNLSNGNGRKRKYN